MTYELFNYNTEEIDYIDCDDKKQISKILDVSLKTEKWHEKLQDKWSPGEAGAQEKLKVFLSNGLNGYSEGRNRPDKQHTSMLSPHIRFGEISIREIAKSIENVNTEDAEIFYKELVWREFSYHLLYHFPHLVNTNLQKKFDNFKWLDNQDHLKSWQKGMTGYPIIDAGMRQLYETGYMHNRVRMIVGSFLVKNLLIHWKYGQEWFWDTLVDADIASNSASWQWVAGTGADAAPYFRIFNPVTQSKKFDPNGDYIKKYIPELKNIHSKYIHLPSELDSKSLRSYGVELGNDYPNPIVDLSITRERALDAFKELSKSTS
jgi:deoxyribodipyrimidine photo-lyase